MASRSSSSGRLAASQEKIVAHPTNMRRTALNSLLTPTTLPEGPDLFIFFDRD
jgi:hypothetical protein